MARGFISGAIWGAVVSGTALSLASLLGDQPAGNAPPEAPQVEAPQSAGTGDGPTAPLQPVADTDSEPVPDVPAATPATPVVSAPSESGSPAPMADTSPAAQPDAAQVDGALAAPTEAGSADIVAGADQPVLPTPQAAPPVVPENEADLSISTDPAQPTPPPVEDTAAFDGSSESAEAVEEGASDGGDDLPDAAEAVEPDPEDGPVADDAAGLEADQGADETVAEEEAPVPSDMSATDDEPAQAANPVEDAAEEPVTVAETESTDEAAAETVTEDDTSDDSDPAETAMPQGDSTITIRRPGADAATVEAETPDEDLLDVTPVPDDAPALLRFAAGFEDPAGKPFLSVILVDTGDVQGGPAVLSGLPFPVTIALDPAADGAADLAAAYRAAGFEILTIANLPSGAQPVDAEVILEAAFSAIPEAIGMIDTGDGGLGAGNLTNQVMAALAAEGRGFVTVSRGLNAALRVAEQAEVPASVIFRDLDAEDQEAQVIRRFLDQAAFRARQDSGVVMLGRVRPDTISALILWGTANRAGQVALVPVSAVLRGDNAN